MLRLREMVIGARSRHAPTEKPGNGESVAPSAPRPRRGTARGFRHAQRGPLLNYNSAGNRRAGEAFRARGRHDMRAGAAALIVAVLTVAAFAQPRTAPSLNLYLIDVEGGNATLIVPPSGESLLIDTGNGGAAAVERCRPDHGRGARRRGHADRSPDHHAFPHRSHRRDGGAGRADTGAPLHRSWPERRAPGRTSSSSSRRRIRRLRKSPAPS